MNRSLIVIVTLLCLVVSEKAARTEGRIPAPQVPEVWTAREAVRFALRNNPDSLIAEKRIAAARASVDGARALYAPEIGLSSEYTQTNNPMYSFGNILNQGKFSNSIDFNNPGRTDNLDFRLQANYRLYNGGRDQATLETAQAGHHGSIANLAVVQHQLGYEVVRQYLAIAQEQETISARLSALEAIRASLAVARARYEQGTLLKADLLSLEAQEAGASEDLIQARHNLELSKRGFLNLLGLQAGDVVIDAKESFNQTLPANLDTTLRPELQVANETITATEAGVRKAEAGRNPTVDGFASYQVDRGTVLSGSGDSWTAGVRVNYTLFDGNRTQASIAEAQARLAEARDQKIKIELALDLELQKAGLEYRQAEERQAATDKMASAAREGARLTRIRFQEGVILSSELIEAEKRLTDALVRQSAARTLRQTALANLRRATGQPQFDQSAEEPQEKR